MSKNNDNFYRYFNCLSEATEQAQDFLFSINRYESNHQQALWSITQRMRHISIDDQIGFDSLWINEQDKPSLAIIAKDQNVPIPDPQLTYTANILCHDVKPILDRISNSTQIQRFFNTNKRQQYQADIQSLIRIYQNSDWEQEIQRLKEYTASLETYIHEPYSANSATQTVSVVAAILDASLPPKVLNNQSIAKLHQACTAYDSIDQSKEKCKNSIQECVNKIRKGEARILMQTTSVKELSNTSAGKIRTSSLSDAGITTVDQVLRNINHLESIPGIGPISAQRIIAAANRLYETASESGKVKLSTNNHDPSMKRLISDLVTYSTLLQMRKSTSLTQTVYWIDSVIKPIPENATIILFPKDSASFTFISNGFATLLQWLDSTKSEDRVADSTAEFEANPAQYITILDNLGLLQTKQASTTGDLDEALIKRVESVPLDTSQLINLSLRGYQLFAAKFTLSQQKVIIGDEMGLGKTIEALAVCSHLNTNQEHTHRFMVICPASVVENWTREIEKHSTLKVYKAHGYDKYRELSYWERQGGICITTYTTLNRLAEKMRPDITIDCLIIDEAHYIKNPDAQRTAHCRTLIEKAQYTMLMTGTPLENNVAEISNLASYINPDIRAKLDASDSPSDYRKNIAPSYLRRNQEDVLTELPKRTDIDDWLDFTAEDNQTYITAVEEDSFVDMRTAGIVNGEKSSKIGKILEVLEQAFENGRKSIIFSYFHVSLNVLCRILFNRHIMAFGPITGNVPSEERQHIIDKFSQYPHPAVLLSQITAGGVGLNIQAASLIIICEPQLKPSTEEQAIARSYRMGQIHPVTIHHLLNINGTDQRIHELLNSKQRIFDQYARESAIAQDSSEAVDISEPQLAKEIIEKEKQRLSEYKQLSVEEAAEENELESSLLEEKQNSYKTTNETEQVLEHYPTEYPEIDISRTNSPSRNTYNSSNSKISNRNGEQYNLPEPVTAIVGEYYHRTDIMAAMFLSEAKLKNLSHNYEKKEYATIEAEPNNPPDKNAIGVWIRGRLVGYIARNETTRWRQLLDIDQVIPAIATVIYSPYSDQFNITVDLRKNTTYMKLRHHNL